MSAPPPLNPSTQVPSGAYSVNNPNIAINKPMRVVFIGNIPYDTTEEQLLALFSTVGPVQSLRLVFDRDTGKPKGYGFCEYQDTETARSCVRNLSNHKLNGRNLRLDFADSMLGAPKDLRKENKAARTHRPNEDYPELLSTSNGEFWDPFPGNSQQMTNSGVQNIVDYGQQPSIPEPMMMMMQGIPPPPPPPSMNYFQQIGPTPPFPQSNVMMMGLPQQQQQQPQAGGYPQGQQQATFPIQHMNTGMPYNGPPPPQFPMGHPNFHSGFIEQSLHSVPQPQLFISPSGPTQEMGHMALPPPPPPATLITALESLPPEQLFSLLSHIKNLTQTQPSQAKELLSSNPHLTYALFHILWRMDLIDAQTIQRTISSLTSTDPSTASPPITTQDPRGQDPRKAPTPQLDPLKADQHQALLDQIRRMTPEQIDALPHEQREKILLLKSKV